MIALDTNILVRFIMQDDPVQSEKANNIIGSLTPGNPALITMVVLCELNRVLMKSYKISKKDRIKTLKNLFTLSVFEIENFEVCLAALKLFKNGKADFSDYLIKKSAENAGYKTVITFHKDALAEKGFELP